MPDSDIDCSDIPPALPAPIGRVPAALRPSPRRSLSAATSQAHCIIAAPRLTHRCITNDVSVRHLHLMFVSALHHSCLCPWPVGPRW